MKLATRPISFLLVLKHQLRLFRPGRLSHAAYIGLLMLLLNVPIGWGGAAICAAIGAKTEQPIWGAISLGVYILSWGMLLLGTYLAGKDTVAIFKQSFPRSYRAWKSSRTKAPLKQDPNP